jgi:DNA gyrase/topoisomerase IV subunit B
MTEQIRKLSEFQHARLRTEMWLGSRDPHTQVVLEYKNGSPFAAQTTWVPALFTAFREVLDNAIDEVVTHGHGDRIDVTYDPKEFIFSIKDNGRGIPIEFDKKHKQYLATMALTETKAGRNFSDDRGATRGLNGVGGSIVNFCSEWFQMDIHRDGKHFSQRFHEGNGEKTAELVIEDPIILPVSAKSKAGTGTEIQFKLSPKVFKNLKLPESFIRARMFEVSLCYPSLKVYYNGERVNADRVSLLAKGGIEKILFPGVKPISIDISEEGFSSRFWLVPRFFDSESDDAVSEFNHSLVNAIPTFNGGIHVETFRRIFFSGMLTALERESKKRKLKPNRSDLADGLLLYNITEMNAPSFDSQSKTRLINEEVGAIIKKALDDPDFFKSVIRRNPEWIDDVYARCAERTQKKDDSETARLAKKTLRNKVKELKDACGVDRSKCILFLGEGDSAISGMVEARNADIHGGLPLRGKVLNVFGESNKTIIENEALAKIMNAIGLVPGQRVNRHALRYGKVYITTDADEDGKNIAALLVNFFYTLWPELFDPNKPPFIYLFDTPLIIAVKGKTRKYWYNDNYHEFDNEAHKGWDVTRAKGLAALKEADWTWALENPKVRPVLDDGKLAKALDLLFNPKLADRRKEWIGM